MKKMNTHYNALKAMALTINGIISDLEEKIDDIDWDKDMTDKDRKRYDKIDDQLSNLEKCAYYIEQAMECLKDYRD